MKIVMMVLVLVVGCGESGSYDWRDVDEDVADVQDTQDTPAEDAESAVDVREEQQEDRIGEEDANLSDDAGAETADEATDEAASCPTVPDSCWVPSDMTLVDSEDFEGTTVDGSTCESLACRDDPGCWMFSYCGSCSGYGAWSTEATVRQRSLITFMLYIEPGVTDWRILGPLNTSHGLTAADAPWFSTGRWMPMHVTFFCSPTTWTEVWSLGGRSIPEFVTAVMSVHPCGSDIRPSISVDGGPPYQFFIDNVCVATS